MFKNRAAGVALSLVLVGGLAAGVVGPAAAAAPAGTRTITAAQPVLAGTAKGKRPADATACTAVATSLVNSLTSAQSSLTAVPPNPTAAVPLVMSLVGDLTGLQATGCLPAIPPTGNLPTPICLPDTSQLLSDVFGLLAALTSVPPNVTGAVAKLTAIIGDLTSLVTATCLPTLPLPLPVGGQPHAAH